MLHRFRPLTHVRGRLRFPPPPEGQQALIDLHVIGIKFYLSIFTTNVTANLTVSFCGNIWQSAVESLPGIRLQTVHHIESMRDIDSCLRMIRRPKGPFPVQRNRLLGRQSARQDK